MYGTIKWFKKERGDPPCASGHQPPSPVNAAYWDGLLGYCLVLVHQKD